MRDFVAVWQQLQEKPPLELGVAADEVQPLFMDDAYTCIITPWD